MACAKVGLSFKEKVKGRAVPSSERQGSTLVWVNVGLDRADRCVTRVSCVKKREQVSLPIHQRPRQI